MRCGGRCTSSKGRKWPGSWVVLGSPVAVELLALGFAAPVGLLEGLLEFVVGFADVFEEEGGRQKSSKRSARREECMWRYVAEESRDWSSIRSGVLFMGEKGGVYHFGESSAAMIMNSTCALLHQKD